jgi:regulator of protease activity HflC (stomatin/prohibitin superfamily)
MNPLATVLGLVLLVALLLVLFRVLFTFVTVHDYERGLRYVNGRFRGLVAEGTHLSMPPFREVRVLDARPIHQVLEGQEVLSADGVAMKIALVARYVVADPVAAVTGDQDFRRATYLTLQLGLRDVLAAGSADELLAARARIGPAVMERAAPILAKLGVEVLSVEVRDMMLPGELKRVFAGVVAARKEGEAALERARGETAALRNLANAARMLEEHPGLVQLRLLQSVGATSGNTIMVGIPDGQGPQGSAGQARRRRTDAAPAVDG